MMEQALQAYAVKQQAGDALDPAALVAELVAQIRPAKRQQMACAEHAIQALSHVLNTNPAHAQRLCEALLHLLGHRKPISLYVDSGIQPGHGFFTEMARRIGHKWLPDAIDPAYLKDLFALIFAKASDEKWVLAVPDEIWLGLLAALNFEQADASLTAPCLQNLLDAAQVLSYRISASGLEPELIRNHPELEDHASPFIMQNIELGEFLASSAMQSIAGIRHQGAAPSILIRDTGRLSELTDSASQVENAQPDIKHILVMIDQCRQVVAKIRRNSAQTGTSIRLTFLLQRINQQIQRLELLLGIIASLRQAERADSDFIRLFKTVVYGECHKNNIRFHWRANMELLALRVTENASRTGEHYITETRGEYFGLMRSAMGAGAVIGVMAMIKIMLAAAHFAPLTEAILFSLNYGIGFVIIHLLHFTVATKQPAMTAAAIAASIDASHGKSRNMDKLVATIAQTMRSQIIAILGNVLLAIPSAMLIGWLIYRLSGHHFVTPEKAHSLLASIDPLYSASFFYAAVAGVCLFLSGLIAGYHDNLAIYNKIPQRLRGLSRLQKLLGKPRLDRVASYVENNLGALAGNFYFGCLLGGMSGLGILLGLPIDIRHITFSSAYVGFSLVALDFATTGKMLVFAALGIAVIGAINLAVSFSLALYVAMKSRKVTFLQWRLLMAALLLRLFHHPREFFIPPRQPAENNNATY